MTPTDDVSRRRFLGLGAAAGGLAAVSSLLPPSLLRAMAETPVRAGGLAAVEHVIVLTQENRSFDHYFGTLRGVRGFGDANPLRQPGGKPVFAQPSPTGDVLPFSLREAAARENRPGTDIQYLGDLPHSWNDATSAWAQGWNNNWVPAKGAATMTHYDRADIPLQYELAETFTVLDAYHCSLYGGTNPNRNFLVSGMTGYEPGTTNRAVTNAAYTYDHQGYDWTTYPERLQAAGVSWQVYQEWDNFNDNAVEYFAAFKRIGTKALSKVKGKFRTTEEFYYALFDKSLSARKKMLDQFAAGLATLTPAERALFDRGMYRSEPDTLVPRLRADIAAGTLPAVSYLVPTAALSEHPGSSTPVGSANLIYQVLDAIASNPDTWSKTVLLINFDENDGYFDHVPAPVERRPASGASDDWYQGRAIGLGPRVPMTVVSPWTIGGHVDSEVADHTSVVRFLERVTGVTEPNISPWRRQLCGDLTSAFDFAAAGTRPSLDQPGPIPPAVTRWRPTPPAQGVLPAQEPGRRPARALPYQPRVSAVVEQGTLRLHLADTGAAASHFAIYPYSGEFTHPEHRDVATEHVEAIAVPAAGYRLAVQGPNRFWYELAGTASGAAAGVAVRSPLMPASGQAAIELSNAGSSEITLTLTAARYGTASQTVTLAAGATTSVAWPTDGGWYDVEVTAAQDATFRRRLTGRVEDGTPGVTA